MGEELANRIAAGEVVNRPASVVKELVENSLDAGAGTIDIYIERGGSRSIKVVDDGAGMDREDLLLCLERFATSKLDDLDGLSRIGTYGFRGEALPSIASVSRMKITTRPRDEIEGWQLESKGGKVMRVDAVGCAPGTAVVVKDIFFNTPARRKFLKSEQTEMSHIAGVITKLALAQPGAGFRLTHNNRKVISCKPGEPMAERAASLLGKDLAGKLFSFARTQGMLSVKGLASPPHLVRRNALKALNFFVNNRPVRDRTLVHAVLAAYGGMVGEGSYPVVLLWIELPSDQVDVNVHPSKQEVRFHKSREVHDLVRQGIADSLAGSPWLPGRQEKGRVVYDRVTGEVQRMDSATVVE